jgi:hypothetical protein
MHYVLSVLKKLVSLRLEHCEYITALAITSLVFHRAVMYALWVSPWHNARLAWNYSSGIEVSLNTERARINVQTLLVSPLPKKTDRKKRNPPKNSRLLQVPLIPNWQEKPLIFQLQKRQKGLAPKAQWEKGLPRAVLIFEILRCLSNVLFVLRMFVRSLHSVHFAFTMRRHTTIAYFQEIKRSLLVIQS